MTMYRLLTELLSFCLRRSRKLPRDCDYYLKIRGSHFLWCMEVKLICMGHMTPLLVTWPRECLGLRQCLVNRYIYSLNYFVRKSILYMYLMMIKSHNLFSVLSCVFWTYDDSVDSTSSWRNKWMKIIVNSLVFVSKCLFLKIVQCDAS